MPVDPGTAFLISQGGGALFDALGGLFGGGGGRRRIKAAEGTAQGLLGTQFNQGNVNQLTRSFQDSLGGSGALQDLARQASSRVGLGSGLGQQHLLGGAQQLTSQFNTKAIEGELQRALQQKMLGARIQAQLAGL